jgi:hypothetical protein
MRSKCLHDKGMPPCKACQEFGLGPEDCIFPVRGQPDNDREYRHPRRRADKPPRRDSIKIRRTILDLPSSSISASLSEAWDDLPPLGNLIDGVNRFTRHYFQLGFIPKQRFPERLRKNYLSVNPFLLLSILSISARLTPTLSARYGSGIKAAEYFMERASNLAIGEIYQEPSLERCQAFYLLSIAQQGSGIRNKSFINMGIAMRMATLMQLHREETYQLQNPTAEHVIRAESARRTLWMLHSQDSLHSSPLCPVSLAAADITALLPCDEDDFASGREPVSRAALEGTLPAIENPALMCDRRRSLFATLMQVHHFWGTVGRRAVNFARSPRPWEANSDFSIMAKKLRDWEQGLPQHHLFERRLLQKYKAEGQDLAYLSATMVIRLCNIVVRRPYLIDIINLRAKQSAGHAFFSAMSTELFRNVRELFEQIEAQFTSRSPDESVGAQMAAFCVYSCGLFSAYLCKYPELCQDPSIVRDGPIMLGRTTAILMECKEVWPLASRWTDALEKFSHDPQAKTIAQEGSMADGKDPVPHALTLMAKPGAALRSAEPTPPPVPIKTPRTPDMSDMTPPLEDSPGDNMLPPLLTDVGGQMYSPIHPQLPLPSAADLPLHSPQDQQATSQMFIPQAAAYPRQQPLDGMGALLDAFGAPAQAAQNPYDLAAASMAFYPALGPSNDGFEDELQYHIDGSLGWMPPHGGWMGSFH